MGLGRIFAAAVLTLVVSGCVLPGGKPAAKPAANPITGAEISTTALDASPNAPAAEQSATPPAKPSGKVIGKDPAPGASPLLAPPPSGFVDASEDAIKAAEAADPAANLAADTNSAQADPAETEAAPAEPKAPPVPQSPEEAKCLKTGGVWATAGKGDAKSCVKATRDAGRACTKETQCEGLCLARSGTCAPVKPLFGCNEIFEADGRRVTLCLD